MEMSITSTTNEFRDATDEEYVRMRAQAASYTQALHREVDALQETLGPACWRDGDFLDRAVDLELRYRFHLQENAQADALLHELHDHGVLVTRYDLGPWILKEENQP